MSDNHRQYRTIRNALNRCYPIEPEDHLASHLNTLAGMVSGIVSSRRTNLPQIAAKVPDGTRVDSRIKRFSRWVNNERLDGETYFLPRRRCCWTVWPPADDCSWSWMAAPLAGVV